MDLDKPEGYLNSVFLEYKVTSCVKHAFCKQDQRQKDLKRQLCCNTTKPYQRNVPVFHRVFPSKKHAATQVCNIGKHIKYISILQMNYFKMKMKVLVKYLTANAFSKYFIEL